jgi:glycosyltransferase involved in cell wall biosynthesis
MNVLVIASDFPNNQQPTRGIFIKQQIAELVKLCELKVIAPIPLALPVKRFKKSYTFSCVAKKEAIDSIETFHPRYLLTPKIGRSFYGLFYFLGIFKTVKSILRSFSFDVILAYFAYPDGFAALLLARLLRKPLVIKVLGSDINVYTKSRIRRFLTVFTLRRAERIIAVTEDLKEKITKLGIPESKITVIYNGVDSNRFKPLDRNECRQKLNLPLDRKILLFIGAFRKVKGVDYLVEAYRKLNDNAASDDLFLVLIGDGDLKEKIEDYIRKFNLQSKVRLAGIRPHNEIPLWINACDTLCLPSINEGCSNIALESLACGKPVVATNVGGTPEIITSENYGVLVNARDVKSLSSGIQKALIKDWHTDCIKKRVEKFTWKATAKIIFKELEIALNNGNKIKVLYHHRTQCNNAEGVHIREMVEALRESGNEVFVVSPAGVETRKDKLNFLWKAISKYMPSIGFEILEIAYNFAGVRNMKKLLRKERIDFIYERYAFFGWVGMFCAKRSKIPLIVEVNFTTYTPLFRKKSKLLLPLARYIEKKVFLKSDAIFVVSSFLKNQLMGLGVPEARIFLTPNAVSGNVFNRYLNAASIRSEFKLNGKSVIGFVGGFYPWHGLDFLLRALSSIEKKTNNICLLLIGDGPEKETLKQISKELNISSEIIFCGCVPYEKLPGYIAAMDICVMPDSNNYGSPMKIFEYMAMAKPVVAPHLAPIEDVITDNFNGMLFKQRDLSSLENCLLQLLKNNEKRNNIGEEARKTIFSKHLWRHNAEKVIQAYDEIK